MKSRIQYKSARSKPKSDQQKRNIPPAIVATTFIPVWTATIRTLLRDMRRSQSATPLQHHLDQLSISICQTGDDLLGVENVAPIFDFLTKETKRELIRHSLRYSRINVLHVSTVVADILRRWVDELEPTVVGDLVAKHIRTFQIKYDPYIQRGETRLFIATPPGVKDQRYTAIVLRERTDRKADTGLTCAELYVLFALAIKQADKYPSLQLLRVRLLVVHYHWVQIVSTEIPRSYISSIVNGNSEIQGQLQLYLSPWRNFKTVDGQFITLLALFESIELLHHQIKPEAVNDVPQQQTPSKSTVESEPMPQRPLKGILEVNHDSNSRKRTLEQPTSQRKKQHMEVD